MERLLFAGYPTAYQVRPYASNMFVQAGGEN